MTPYHKIWRGLLAASVVFGVATLGTRPAQAADEANPNGTWKFSLTFRDLGDVEELKLDLMVTLKEENGKLTGKIGGAMGEGMVDILDGTFKGREVAFRVVDQAGTPSRYRGKVEGDKIKGTFEADLPGVEKAVHLDWNASRVKDKK